jgi:hypothetical protein
LGINSQEAAEIASKKVLNEADHFDDCDGHTFAALVDEECDLGFRRSSVNDPHLRYRWWRRIGYNVEPRVGGGILVLVFQAGGIGGQSLSGNKLR